MRTVRSGEFIFKGMWAESPKLAISLGCFVATGGGFDFVEEAHILCTCGGNYENSHKCLVYGAGLKCRFTG